ncbi:MAG TPA: 16S rRNA (cytosine(967)-C(5))-methyltransferase RsmB [Candidatus Binatia bacterium]|jgi:16S rRNA (cytosine967-C5)-methyltransferase
MTESDPRRLAAAVLLAVEDGAWSDEALSLALDGSRLRDVDRPLATRLVYGVLARQRTLDHTILAYAARPVRRIEPVVLVALRLGLFQMAFLDRVPDHAAVATSVDLVTRRAPGARGFVNALLRRVQREGLAPAPRGNAGIGVSLSHPDWLAAMWRKELGDEPAALLMAADNDAAPTCYRVLGNRDVTVDTLRAAGIDATAGRFASSAMLVAGPVRHFDGVAVPQGEASQLVVQLLEPRPGEAVLDACAAPGGKTAAIAAAVGAGGRVVACDPSPQAGARVRALLDACAAKCRVDFHARAVEQLEAEVGRFDAVLVDAPCSGLGTLRQHPEIRWRRSRDDLDDLARRQGSILNAASRFVKPAGRLVYSTCTIARAENDDVVAAFLESHSEFSRDAADAVPAALVDDSGALRTFPHRDGLDGFFAVRLVRRPPKKAEHS